MVIKEIPNDSLFGFCSMLGQHEAKSEKPVSSHRETECSEMPDSVHDLLLPFPGKAKTWL